MLPKRDLSRNLPYLLVLVPVFIGLLLGGMHLAARTPAAPLAPISTATSRLLQGIATPGAQPQTTLPSPNGVAPSAGPRGYPTTPGELERIARSARAGVEPERAAVADLLRYAKEAQGKPPLG